MNASDRVEKFTLSELSALRGDLLRAELDSWQAADLISGFLSGRGYGVSTEHLRSATRDLHMTGPSLERMQATLERIAFYN